MIGKHSEETKRKISESRKKNPGLGNTGNKHTPEAKARMSEAAKNRKRAKHSEETKSKLSKAKLGNTYFKGHKLTDLHKEKLRLANTGRTLSESTKIKISEAKRGNTCAKGQHNITEVGKANMSRAGSTLSLDHKLKIAKAVAEGKSGYKASKTVKYISKFGQQITFRSSWEYKVAAYLDELGWSWIYEWDILTLDNEVYLPDFFIFDEVGNWIKVIEVKGYFPEKDRTIFNDFKQALADLGIELELWNESKLKELGLL